MNIDSYFETLSKDFEKAYSVAKDAREKGLDPKHYVEIKPAPDLASRVEGLTNVEGVSEMIRRLAKENQGSRLAFAIVKEICADERFDGYETIKRIELAVRIGTAILTEGILVAPTEGISSVKRYKNRDGTDYIAVNYAGPIRGAGGTVAALSVALADYARRIFKIGSYRATMDEIERYVEETEIYHERCARLQYRPSDDDIRTIVSNCPVCVDGVPTETIEISVHSNIDRIGFDNKTVQITNRVRGGVPLVLCEGIAQKAKKVLKETKGVGLDWDWLNNTIKVDVKKKDQAKDEGGFLDELVAGRPILSYPGYSGGFRLRYGRSRFTGIASKGFSVATMILTMGYVAVGTQLKIEFPGKGCIATPVDSIEGPFVKLKSGEALRVNDAETAMRLKDEVIEIIALGDMLVTYGDFRKSNTQLKPSSYVEELWELELRNADKKAEVEHARIDFAEAYGLSLKHKIPIHPKFLFEFQAISKSELTALASEMLRSSNLGSFKRLADVGEVRVAAADSIKRILEKLNAPHRIDGDRIVMQKDYGASLAASLGFMSGVDGVIDANESLVRKYEDAEDALTAVNSVAPFRIMRRSTFVGTRIGRPEKARERLMKPAPNVLFPISGYGGKERNISSAYSADAKRFRSDVEMEMARYGCPNCKRIVDSPFCYDCMRGAIIESVCPACRTLTLDSACPNCKSQTVAYDKRSINLAHLTADAMKRLGIGKLPKVVKGVRGMTNRNKCVEVLEKGILRSANNIYIFKDGTSRFDATDVPITHFYPKEMECSVEKMRALGYDVDYKGNKLESDTQLVEMRHQDVILNRRGAEYMLRTSKFVDQMLEKLYGIPPFYGISTIQDLIGTLVITLSPHTSCGVLNRIIGFTDANVGFAHPYTISARRRNADGDEDTTMLLLDALINFSKEYLPTTVGGTMDTPLILTVNVKPKEVDDEAHAMEVVESYGLDFYLKTFANAYPSEVKLELVEDRLSSDRAYSNLGFTHQSGIGVLKSAPRKSRYTELKTMQEKIDDEFKLMDMLDSVNKRDAARKVIMSHFIPDLIGNLHSFSRQTFRCSTCTAKYRRVPLSGRCQRDNGKLLLTISKGGIEKYLGAAINLAERYQLDTYTRQRLYLIRDEINDIFEVVEKDSNATEGQFSLLKYV
ncbi:MAG: DNA polymerase II large subunit [Candidatus Micrarchaeota archaeon]|nr:DNA polymerase II large subunit [Candidatus Micrarchaeota archaeon]